MRVKRGKSHLKHRRHLLKEVKGYKWGRKKKIKLAKIAAWKAGVYAIATAEEKKEISGAYGRLKLTLLADSLV